MQRIKISDRELEVSIRTRYADPTWEGRACKAITCALPSREAVSLFSDGVTWGTVNREGGVEDLSEYALAGPVTDHRDGTVTVLMGKYTPAELMATSLGAVPADYASALTLRRSLESLAQTVQEDGEAVCLKGLYPTWETLVEGGFTAAEAGFRFRYGAKLYKTAQAGVAFVSHYLPGEGTESLYICIDDSHAGTAEDPIPYDGNMELTAGLCYLQGGVTYLCVTSTGVAVHHPLSELEGLYVEALEVAA